MLKLWNTLYPEVQGVIAFMVTALFLGVVITTLVLVGQHISMEHQFECARLHANWVHGNCIRSN